MQQEELTFDGKIYISAKRASELTGYTRDYVGQLARSGKIGARRIDRTWFIDRDSILSHKTHADQYVPVPPAPPVGGYPTTPNSIVSLDGREFISAKRASELFGYNGDYVAQLARDGKIESKQIGGRWYIDRTQLFDHKKKNDALLASVQAQSSGYVRPSITGVPRRMEMPTPELMHYGSEDESDLIPNPSGNHDFYSYNEGGEGNAPATEEDEVLDLRGQRPMYEAISPVVYTRPESKAGLPILRSAAYGIGALTITAAIFIGVAYLPTQAMVASASNASLIEELMSRVPENFLSTELIYKRLY